MQILKGKEIVGTVIIILLLLFGKPKLAEAYGLPSILPGHNIKMETRLNRPYYKPKQVEVAVQAPIKINKVKYNILTVKDILPIFYLNGKNIYINEKIFNHLGRGSNMEDLFYGLFVMSLLIVIFSSIDETATGFLLDKLKQFNAPTPNLHSHFQKGSASSLQQEIVRSTIQRVARQNCIRLQLQIQPYTLKLTQVETFTYSDGSPNLFLVYREVLRRAQNYPNFS